MRMLNLTIRRCHLVLLQLSGIYGINSGIFVALYLFAHCINMYLKILFTFKSISALLLNQLCLLTIYLKKFITLTAPARSLVL